MDFISAVIAFCSGMGIPFALNQPLSRYTTFKIGGPAALMIFPESTAQVAAVRAYCSQNQFPLFVMGKGSNILAADEGYAGAIILLGSGFSHIEKTGETEISAQSGASLSAVCRFAAEQSLTGLEFAFGIPGSVGGGAVMNAGAYGGDFSGVVKTVEAVDTEGSVLLLQANELEYGYRHSRLQTEHLTVTKVVFALRKGQRAVIEAKMAELMNRRVEKQPLELPSAGSTFLRPPGHFAGGLIEQAGLKGRKVGGAGVSEKHAGFVVNTGEATCKDVLALIETIKREVLAQSGVQLDCEIKILK